MTDTIFLYLDFLGFRELATNPQKIRKLFETLDSSRIHHDSNFQTIVFSDTLIAYNREKNLSDQDKINEVMFLIELVQDITHRLTGSGITFRAIITEGEFEHNKLNNFDAYFGNALISTHDTESTLPGLGLYLHDKIQSLDKVFRSIPCGSNMNFSYLAYDLVRAEDNEIDYPIDPLITGWEEASIEVRILFQIEHLREMFNGLSHESMKIRSKYASSWGMYVERCPRLTRTLRESNFDPSSLCKIDWTEATETLKDQQGQFNI